MLVSDLLSVLIETSRLVMRPVSRDRAAEISAAFTPEVCRYMFPQPASEIAETLDFIDRARAKMALGEELVVSVFARADGALLGGAGLHDLSSGAPEVGIWVKLSAHGHGFGLEAVEGLISWGDANPWVFGRSAIPGHDRELAKPTHPRAAWRNNCASISQGKRCGRNARSRRIRDPGRTLIWLAHRYSWAGVVSRKFGDDEWSPATAISAGHEGERDRGLGQDRVQPHAVRSGSAG